MRNGKKIGLALSGGGYRAAAFHLGTLKKLSEMSVLEDIDIFSTISGGSITGACYCLHKGNYDSFHNDLREKISTKSIIADVLRSWVFIRTLLLLVFFLVVVFGVSLSNYSIFTIPILAILLFIIFRYQYKIFPISKAIIQSYNKQFYNGAVLSQLNEIPVLAIGASNLHTGRPFVFSKQYIGDTSYNENWGKSSIFSPTYYPIAEAVMASSCVPFAFSPVHIKQSFFTNTSDFKKYMPVLVDGGVYDNQGIHKLTHSKSRYTCDFIIISDAGGQFKADKQYNNALTLLIRTVDMFMYRIKTLQMTKDIYENANQKPIAYFSLGWDLDKCIPGFINNMIQGQVLPEILRLHQLPDIWIANPETYKTEIKTFLEEKTGYNMIKNRNLSEGDLLLAQTTRTNLTKLSPHRISCLITHASNLTELQVKLYCPQLLSDKS